MNNSINKASREEKEKVANMIREDYENKGQSFAFDMVNAFNKNHVLVIPYEHCGACETSSPAIDNCCLICGQSTLLLTIEDFIKYKPKSVTGIVNSDGKLVKRTFYWSYSKYIDRQGWFNRNKGKSVTNEVAFILYQESLK